MATPKTIALVAHDNCKKDMVEWVDWNWSVLLDHQLICTGTTGRLVEEALARRVNKEHPLLHPVIKLKSGPFGGDQQLGAMIADGKIDILIFFWDPMQPQPHDVDVKALLRISVLYNIPAACNRSSADFIISSTLMKTEYMPIRRDYSEYLKRDVGV
ncbi:MAG TPA: methylglyoxal synthase [Spirochaetia bacterium]